MKQSLAIYWARRDFRLADNPALQSAIEFSNKNAVPLLPLFILEDYMVAGNPNEQFGYPSRWFLSRALPAFAAQFPHFAVARGKAAQYLKNLAEQYDITLHVNDDVYPDFYTQVTKLKDAGIRITVCEDALTVSKETRTGTGNLYSVFTPFKKAVWSEFIRLRTMEPLDVTQVTYADVVLPNAIPPTTDAIMACMSPSRMLMVGAHILDLDTLTRKPDLALWYTAEADVLTRFDEYLTSGLLDAYAKNRDSLEGDTSVRKIEHDNVEGRTSRMSLALAWGLVSSRTLVSCIQQHFGESFDNPFSNRVSQGALIYVSELIWREFYRYQLFHHPELMQTEFQERFRGTIKWVSDADALERFTFWIQGKTGYPIVDAAMRQVAETGWMHNRARMIVASILTKNLGVDWRWGQEYFRAMLIDLDEASNNGGWQWGASVGADPKPIRIFNPELQAKNYDASGAYRERWRASESLLQEEVVPIIPHADAREEALTRYGLSNTKPRDY